MQVKSRANEAVFTLILPRAIQTGKIAQLTVRSTVPPGGETGSSILKLLRQLPSGVNAENAAHAAQQKGADQFKAHGFAQRPTPVTTDRCSDENEEFAHGADSSSAEPD